MLPDSKSSQYMHCRCEDCDLLTTFIVHYYVIKMCIVAVMYVKGKVIYPNLYNVTVQTVMAYGHILCFVFV